MDEAETLGHHGIGV